MRYYLLLTPYVHLPDLEMQLWLTPTRYSGDETTILHLR